MHNLLPSDSQKKILKEYHLRLLSSAFLFAFYLGIIVFAALFPSYILTRSKERTIELEKERVTKTVKDLEAENLNTFLGDTKSKVENLEAFSGKHSLLNVIDVILSEKTEAISIDGFSLGSETPGEGGLTRDFVINGVAATREALQSFEKRLETRKDFSWTVTLPISEFAKQSNIDFTLNIRVTFPS